MARLTPPSSWESSSYNPQIFYGIEHVRLLARVVPDPSGRRGRPRRAPRDRREALPPTGLGGARRVCGSGGEPSCAKGRNAIPDRCGPRASSGDDVCDRSRKYKRPRRFGAADLAGADVPETSGPDSGPPSTRRERHRPAAGPRRGAPPPLPAIMRRRASPGDAGNVRPEAGGPGRAWRATRSIPGSSRWRPGRRTRSRGAACRPRRRESGRRR